MRAMRPGIPAVCPGSPVALLRKATRAAATLAPKQAGCGGDGDYRANQAQAQQAWAARHGDYWREYRANHPDYTDRNRLEQRRRDRRRRMARLAKMDASTPIHPVPSGTYRLLSEAGGISQRWTRGRSKSPISRDYAASGEAGAILQREDVIGAAGPPC